MNDKKWSLRFTANSIFFSNHTLETIFSFRYYLN